MTSSLRTIHTPLSQKRFTQTPHGSVESVSRFLKLDPGGYCNTLRARTASDRGAFTSPRPIHPYTPRCITVREAARCIRTRIGFAFTSRSGMAFARSETQCRPCWLERLPFKLLLCFPTVYQYR